VIPIDWSQRDGPGPSGTTRRELDDRIARIGGEQKQRLVVLIEGRRSAAAPQQLTT